MSKPSGSSAHVAALLFLLSLASEPVLANTVQAPATDAPPSNQQPADQSLSLRQIVEQLRTANRTIAAKQAESRIAANAIDRARGAFQPQAEASLVRGNSRVKNTYEEELIRKGLGVYERDGNDFSAGISQLLSTGAKVEAKVTLSRFFTNTNQSDPLRPPGAYDNRGFYGLTLTQPLARDGGEDATLARVRVAELDALTSGFTAKDTETTVVADAVMLYHELTFAQDRVKAARERIRNAERLQGEALALQRAGRLPATDVWEVQNALDRYRAGLSEAQQFELERANRLRTMLTQNGRSTGLLRTIDPLPDVTDSPLPVEDSVRTALDHRADYRALKVAVDRENTQLGYSRNQALPRFDLVGTYGRNGLEYAARDALSVSKTRDYPSWSLGLQFSMPLGRNVQAEADIQTAVIRLEEARRGIQALEVQIANDIDTALSMRTRALERWRLWREVHEREKQQLEAERSRFTGGRSDTRELLLKEERVVNSQLNVREQQLAFTRAELLLQAAQGVLLDRLP
jgi:outer membrane protein TolC